MCNLERDKNIFSRDKNTKDTCECQFDNDMIYKTEMTNKAYRCNCGGTREKYKGQVQYIP